LATAAAANSGSGRTSGCAGAVWDIGRVAGVSMRRVGGECWVVGLLGDDGRCVENKVPNAARRDDTDGEC